MFLNTTPINTGTPTFGRTNFSVSEADRQLVHVSLGDRNGDGRLDIVTANNDSVSSISVLLNETVIYSSPRITSTTSRARKPARSKLRRAEGPAVTTTSALPSPWLSGLARRRAMSRAPSLFDTG